MKIKILSLHVDLPTELAHRSMHRGYTHTYVKGLQIAIHAGLVGILGKLLCEMPIISLAVDGTIIQSRIVCRPMCRVGEEFR